MAPVFFMTSELLTTLGYTRDKSIFSLKFSYFTFGNLNLKMSPKENIGNIIGANGHENIPAFREILMYSSLYSKFFCL